jgi:phosphotriesterase-related protein
MPLVETVAGPVEAGTLGVTLMHEHVFILNEELARNYPGGWDEDARIEDAVAKLSALAARGCTTIADPTVIGLGRDIERVSRVAARIDLNIIAATGLYTYNDVPLYFRYRGADRAGTSADPMTRMFIGDLTEGIAGTGIRAAFLKCAIEEEGLTPGVRRVLRAVAAAHAATGAPVMVHTHPGSGSGLTALDELATAGTRPGGVLLAHCGDTADLDYLTRLADAGCLLGMDRFGLDIILPFAQRVAVVAAMCERGYAESMVLAHDASCHIDWFEPAQIAQFAPSWHYQHIFDDVIPALRARGVTQSQLDTMLITNPCRFFSAP